jgi:hypothetical protein
MVIPIITFTKVLPQAYFYYPVQALLIFFASRHWLWEYLTNVILVTRHVILVTRHFISVTRHVILVTRHVILVTRRVILVTRHVILVTRREH